VKIIVNGEPQDTRAKTLDELCAALGLANSRVATAVNGDFVPAPIRADYTLEPNDRIEFVTPRQGG
jgi:sulfur carrier protein